MESIHSQKEVGWKLLPEHYDDGGFSGATLDRPALRRLLDEMDARRVDCVVVYKVSSNPYRRFRSATIRVDPNPR